MADINHPDFNHSDFNHIDFNHSGLKDFSSLVDSYYSRVFHHCVKITKNNHDSADITQNTFIKAFIKIENLKNADSFGAWIFTICNNEIKMFYRNSQKTISDNSVIERIPYKPSSGDQKKYNSLYSAIDGLEEKYRNLVILKYFAEFSVKEISILTGIDEKLIKSRLYDARKKLEKLLTLPESQNSAGLLNNYNRERKKEIMSSVKLLELGLSIIPSISAKGLNELLKCAENNTKFSNEVLSELAKFENGNEFTAECRGTLSYDEFIRILAGCDWGVLYEFYDTHKIMRDVARYHGTGGYVETIEAVLYVPSIPDTVKWYKKFLGWDGDSEAEGYAQINVCRNEDVVYMSKADRRFHLRKAGEGQSTTKCSFFIIVTHKQLELIRERVMNAGLEKVSEIHDAGFGPMRFIVEDLNGVGLEFLEWNHDSQ